MLFSSNKNAVASFLRRSPVTKRHGESRILKTHPLHLFRIIQDVDKYHEFLPLCHKSRVFPETIRSNGRTFEAQLQVGKPPLFFETYISRVTVIPEQLRVESESISSEGKLFESLKSSWQLRRVDPSLEKGNKEESGTVVEQNRDFDDHHSGTATATSSNIACHIDFEVEMTVTDPLVIGILDTVLMQVAGRQVEAFDQRCQELPWPEKLLERIQREGRRR